MDCSLRIRCWANLFTHVITFNYHNDPWGQCHCYSIVRKRKLRLRKVKWLVLLLLIENGGIWTYWYAESGMIHNTKKWKQPTRPPTGEEINKIMSIHTTGCSLATPATTWMSLVKMMLRERTQTLKASSGLIPLIWKVQNKQTYRDRKQMSSCLELREGVSECQSVQGSFGVVMKMFFPPSPTLRYNWQIKTVYI